MKMVKIPVEVLFDPETKIQIGDRNNEMHQSGQFLIIQESNHT